MTKKTCFGQYLSEFLTELPQTTTSLPWHGPLQMMTWIITNHYKSPQVYHDMNHHKSQITTNHHKPWHKPPKRNLHKAWHESLQITTNHDMNHHDDPKRALHKAIWLPCYEWHCLDLIVTFLWTTLSRSNCDLFMNNTV